MSAPAMAQERVLVPSAGDGAEVVELFVHAPEGTGPWPVILFVHGHQSAPRPGGRVFMQLDRRPTLGTLDEGRLERMRERGYLAAAVSLPGYGETPGPSDFWGPRAQAALSAALDYLLGLPDADRGRVAVYGVSGGAMTAAIVATRDPRITALVLAAGLYDLGKAYPTGDPGLDAYIEREAGLSPEAFAARSALRGADGIRAATLILHGANDTRGTMVSQARRLAERLRERGVPVRARIFEDTGHSIPIGAQWEEIDPFLMDVIGR
ncbi:MAG TPA: prolyl oligopeptidase family serine peptidase [Microvirga sp.]|nr:prolyl oligopeptidase family serine peptidase [Microvirga sp.]